ncbi:ScyD/ScyE family protein [Nocardioides sp. YIM 152315]|uniref:ScyD/ScyE family protein n=1 Tax=Nocardioides sp. YIM 152315 TaxID=3031760 RepID=UPI0023D9F3C6|nr:ScyD/ScyE family protein [Nocardioides sp. YIM 152315]MDF1603906.1 ScyD/ScyE family protein [Nocardioides sp. YIM 152315]
MRRTRIVAATATLALAATTAVLVPASQAAAPKPKTLAKNLVAPLSVAIDDDGTAYVTQNFAGTLSRVAPGKKPKTVYASKGGNEVGGVSVFHGKVVFTETKSDAQGNPKKSWVKWITPSGKVKTLANVRKYENKKNPDGDVMYGVRGITDECAAQWPTEEAGPATHPGIPDSHPYSTYQVDEGTVFVADAGMNAVLSISPKGKIRTLAVLPPAAVKITAPLAAGAGIPDCAVGLTYYSEPVPTDVQKAGKGKLLVTTEGGGLGEMMPLGGVYRVPMKGGKAKQVAGGLFAPTGLAVAANGDVYVAQLFGGEISRIKHGTKKVRTYAKAKLPAAVEWTPDGLYATTKVLGPEGKPPTGKLVRFGR